MAVRIRYAPGGDTFPTQFSDTLQTQDPNNPNANGRLSSKNWAFSVFNNLNTTTPVGLATYSIVASVLDAQNCLSWAAGPAINNPNQSMDAAVYPIVLWPAVYGKTQFVQCTLVHRAKPASSTGNSGLCVMLNPMWTEGNTNAGISLPPCYVLNMSSDGTNTNLGRFGINSEGDAAVLHSFANGTFADGDILRLSADVSVAGQVTLRTSKNGTLIDTTVDNSASRIAFGGPGLNARAWAIVGASAASIMEWRTFSAGLGL